MGYMYFWIAMSIISSYIGATAAKYIGVIGNRPWESIFIPDHIEPTRYDLRISPDFHHNDSYFNGHVIIHLKVKTRTDIIMIHSKQLQINSWTVMDSKYRRLAVNSYFPYERHDYLVFKTKYPLPERAKLELSFFGNISTVEEGDPVTPNGLYKIPYVDKLNGKQSWVLVSDFRHGGSRFAFPSFDDPQFESKFNIIIRHRKNFTALTNMPLKSQESYARLYDLTKFKLSPKMTTDHVRITISEFSFKNATVNGTEYRVWARPDRLNEVDYALNVTTTLQNYLFQELGQSYLLERFDQFAVPGSLVHDNSKSWGLATYKESRLLVNVTEEADDTKDEALKLIAKTLAHGYFETYAYSHNRIRHHYWLKEGLTKFYATRALRAIDPTLFHMELYNGEGHTLFLDGTDKTRPLVADAPGFDNINPVLGYKGAGILRMVESFVGRDGFRLAIIRFLQDYRNRTIKTRKFFRAIQQNAGLSLRLNTIMQTWVFGNGTPVIRVELLPGDVINATQKQFLFNYKLSGNNTQKWYVPLTYRTGEGNHGLVWMNETDVVFNVTLESSDDWIVFNGERSGYYRVQYDANLMNRIVKQLNENHTVFTELTRSTLLNDAITFVDAKQLGYDIFLTLTKYASNEADLTPWVPIADGFHEIYKHIRHTNIANRFQSYVLNLTSKLMDEFLVNDAVSNPERQLRRIIMRLSCAAGHEGCMEIGIREFQTWIQNQTHVVPEHDRPEAYCNAMANSVDEGDWMTTFERYVRANSTRERDQLLYILCCSRNLTILQWLLDFSMNVTDRHTRSENVFDETHVIMEYIARNPSANTYMWNWFKSNFAEIDRVFQIGSAGILVAAPASEFTTQAQNEELLEFYNTYNGSIPNRWQKRTKNHVKRNLRWMDKHFNTITRWLEQDASAK